MGAALSERVLRAYNDLAFHQVCEEVFALVRTGNKYIDDQAPWRLFKSGHQAAVEEVLYSVLESLRLAAYLLAPMIPNLSTKIYQQLGFGLDFNDWPSVAQQAPFAQHIRWGSFPLNPHLASAQPIFTRLELPADANVSEQKP